MLNSNTTIYFLSLPLIPHSRQSWKDFPPPVPGAAICRAMGGGIPERAAASFPLDPLPVGSGGNNASPSPSRSGRHPKEGSFRDLPKIPRKPAGSLSVSFSPCSDIEPARQEAASIWRPCSQSPCELILSGLTGSVTPWQQGCGETPYPCYMPVLVSSHAPF